MVVLIYTSTRTMWNLADLHSFQHLKLSDILIFAYRMNVYWYLILILICIFCFLISLNISLSVYWLYVFLWDFPAHVSCSCILLMYHVFSCLWFFFSYWFEGLHIQKFKTSRCQFLVSYMCYKNLHPICSLSFHFL